MLHTRTLAVAAASPLIVESVLPFWLVRASASHVVPKRSVGDRALSRGQISRNDMLDNYQKTREKYKCEYRYADSGHLISASFSVPSHRSAFYLGRTFTRSAARFARACARLDVSIFRLFDISIFRYFDSSIFRYFEPMQLARDLDSSSIHAEIIIDLLMHPPFQEAFDLRLISKLNQIYVCTTVEYNFICCAKQQRYDHITIAFLANFKNVSYIGSINSFRCIQIDR